jgi:predicted CoA-binding protein
LNRDKIIKEILSTCKTIAVVGLSREPDKESYIVSAYMQKHGFRIIPVNPFADEVLGEKSYKSLIDIPAKLQKNIDIVDIFRKADDVPPVVEQALKLKEKHGKPCVVWMQLGIVNEKAAADARKAGLTVIMDKCIMQEHKRLIQVILTKLGECAQQ